MLKRPGAKGDGDAQGGEEQRRRLHEGLGELGAAAQRADEELRETVDRVRAGDEHREAADDDDDRTRQRRGAPVRVHVAPAIRRPTCERSIFALATGSLKPARVHHSDAIGEREDLVEIERDEQDRTSGVARFDETRLNDRRRADVDAARRLVGEDEARIVCEGASDDDLLLVAAGQRPDTRVDGARPHVEAFDDGVAALERAFFRSYPSAAP